MLRMKYSVCLLLVLSGAHAATPMTRRSFFFGAAARVLSSPSLEHITRAADDFIRRIREADRILEAAKESRRIVNQRLEQSMVELRLEMNISLDRTWTQVEIPTAEGHMQVMARLANPGTARALQKLITSNPALPNLMAQADQVELSLPPCERNLDAEPEAILIEKPIE
jgi:hypothetical protein